MRRIAVTANLFQTLAMLTAIAGISIHETGAGILHNVHITATGHAVLCFGLLPFFLWACAESACRCWGEATEAAAGRARRSIPAPINAAGQPNACSTKPATSGNCLRRRHAVANADPPEVGTASMP